jgi:hypothetical protein
MKASRLQKNPVRKGEDDVAEDLLTYAMRLANVAAEEARADGCPESEVKAAWAIRRGRALCAFVRCNDPSRQMHRNAD